MKLSTLFVVVLFCGSCFGQGAVFAGWLEPVPSGEIVAWQFAIGYGFAPTQAANPPAYGTWAYNTKTHVFGLRSNDLTVKFTGTFDAPLAYVPIDGHCGQLSGTLTGTLKVPNPKDKTKSKWFTNAHAIYSQTQCSASVPGFEVGWLGGGNLTVLTH